MTARRPTRPPGLLVDTAWLGDLVGARRLAPVDLRDRDDYLAGHIPGAVHLDLEDLGSSRDGCDNVLISPVDFERTMARLGISNQDTVVAYDDHWGLPSARLVWSLHYHGHPSAVVLNGGWDLWNEEGRVVSDVPPPKKAGAFEVRLNPDVHADFEWISEIIARDEVVLLDTRSETEFDAGHLPGARSWDWFKAVPEGSWVTSRDPEALRSEWAELGVRPSDEIVAYCRSGMRAAHTYVVLRHAGFTRVRVFDGSWQEWSMRMGDA